MVRNAIRNTAVFAMFAVLLTSCGLKRHKYENPITKDTQQPDKVLFDTAIDDLEHGRYERARLTLQTLMNTYDTSEYMAKAKLALADSWYREGGAHGFAQAEVEYKDFILFYPQMEEAAEAQEKICNMQYRQMDKSDRDPSHALRAEDECRQLIVQFPNSKFAPQAEQQLRNIQEVLADAEYRVGTFYYRKGSYPASANRLQALAEQFPLYSDADEGLWDLAQDYQHMGDHFENQQAAAYTKIVRDYPLSAHAEDAAARLKEMGRPVPEADPVAYARQKYNLENQPKRSLLSKAWGPFSGHPYLGDAARTGTPVMENFHPMIPASVPALAAGTQGVSSDVSAAIATDTSLLDKSPDARANPPAAGAPAAAGGTANPAGGTPAAGGTQSGGTPAAGAPAAGTPASGTPAASAQDATATPPPQNHTGKPKKQKKVKPSKKDLKAQPQQQSPAPAATPPATPALPTAPQPKQ
jgi:outer membrane protein assembly factor BamD